jgi:hypothetical protein
MQADNAQPLDPSEPDERTRTRANTRGASARVAWYVGRDQIFSDQPANFHRFRRAPAI